MAASNIFNEVLERVRAVNGRLIASGMLPAEIDQSRVIVEPPRDPSHGDMATNAAMVLAKDAGRKPRELAQAISDALATDDLVQKVDVAGPGFINITLKPAAWTEALRTALRAGIHYGKSDFGRGEPVNVEYVSANPTGPMH
ncbi:MAG TPA: arginine--tRNA ligase, partial [Xanthobacteraceae bacterium]|nr:arginine--tRNA ligase [Xanthobacteraceae bacterium]